MHPLHLLEVRRHKRIQDGLWCLGFSIIKPLNSLFDFFPPLNIDASSSTGDHAAIFTLHQSHLKKLEISILIECQWFSGPCPTRRKIRRLVDTQRPWRRTCTTTTDLFFVFVSLRIHIVIRPFMNNTLFSDIACICNTCLIPIFKRVQKKRVSFQKFRLLGIKICTWLVVIMHIFIA